MWFILALRRLSNAYPVLYSKNYNVCNNLCRNYAKDIKLKWVRPEKVPSYEPSQTGDLTPFQMPKGEEIRELFRSCELIHKSTNDNVKKIFSFKNQSRKVLYSSYKMHLIDKVKSHAYENSSVEVKIAKLTATIRILQHIIPRKRKDKKYALHLNALIHKRRSLLKYLRTIDYKKFEWLLEKLDLKYFPDPIKKEIITRKKSTKLLAELRSEKMKELKLGEHKKILDQQKVPFLEKKLKMLKYIKEQESNFNLEPTVTHSEIENCTKQIENVKIQVEENMRKGYVRKVHPYTLEVYRPAALETPNTD